MCFNGVTASTPQYLAEVLQTYTPSRALPSAGDARKFKIPLRKMKFSEQKQFPYQGPGT